MIHAGGFARSASAASKRRKPGGGTRHRRREKPHRALARLDVTRLRAQMAEHDERARRDAVARRCRVVVPGLRPVEKPLVVVAREEEAAVLRVFELVQQNVGELARPRVVLDAKPRLHELEQRVEQERVIVEVRVEVRALALARGEQPAVAPRRAAQRVGSARRRAPPTAARRARAPHGRIPRWRARSTT